MKTLKKLKTSDRQAYIVTAVSTV